MLFDDRHGLISRIAATFRLRTFAMGNSESSPSGGITSAYHVLRVAESVSQFSFRHV